MAGGSCHDASNQPEQLGVAPHPSETIFGPKKVVGHSQDMEAGAIKVAEKYKEYMVELRRKYWTFKLEDMKEKESQETKEEHSLSISVFQVF